MNGDKNEHEAITVITAAHLYAGQRVLEQRMTALEQLHHQLAKRFDDHMAFLRSAFVATFILALGGFGTVTWAVMANGLGG
jgi:hypothetical protein